MDGHDSTRETLEKMTIALSHIQCVIRSTVKLQIKLLPDIE